MIKQQTQTFKQSKRKPIESKKLTTICFEGIIRDLAEAVLNEFLMQNKDQLISDTNKQERKGIFIKEIPQNAPRQSLLTKALSSRSCFTPNSDYYYLEPLNESDQNYFNINVLIADIGEEAKLVASKKNTVEDIVNFVYSICVKKGIQGIYKYAEGYELRLVDDGKPIYEMSSLNPSRQLGDYELDNAAFCRKRNFTRPSRKSTETSLKKKAEKLGMVMIKVHVVEDKGITTLLVQSEPEELLENVFAKIAHKRALVRKTNYYKFIEYSHSMLYAESIQTLLKYDDPLNIKEISMSLPVKGIKVPELVLVERFFADVPEGGLKRYKLPIHNRDPEYLHLPKEQLEEWDAQIDCIDVFSDTSFDYNVCFPRNSLGI